MTAARYAARQQGIAYRQARGTSHLHRQTLSADLTEMAAAVGRIIRRAIPSMTKVPMTVRHRVLLGVAALSAVVGIGIFATAVAANGSKPESAAVEAPTSVDASTPNPMPTTETPKPKPEPDCEYGQVRGEYETREICSDGLWVADALPRPTVVDRALVAANAQVVGVPATANCAWPASFTAATPVT